MQLLEEVHFEFFHTVHSSEVHALDLGI